MPPSFGRGRVAPTTTTTINYEIIIFLTFKQNVSIVCTYAVFTLNGFDNQERKLTFAKTDFQVLKLKFHACNFKQAFYPLQKLLLSRDFD